jgi:sensor histidine kinase regulating citrate/malate metabolism
VRFYVPNNDPTLPDTKWDVAVGISREVTEQIAEISSDSLISTAVLGALLLIIGTSVAWAARKVT